MSIHSGHTATHGLHVTNTGDADLVVDTNGHLTADIIDSGSHRVIGGYTGGHLDMLIPFPIPTHTTVRIPLLVGTASYDPHLGYAIPPGAWALRCTLRLTDGRSFTTPALPFTITQ